VKERDTSQIDTKVLGFVSKMPSLSPTVGKIVSLANDLNSSARDLVKVIKYDPVLMAKVLKLINSSYFGIPREITSINRAVLLLGINTVKNLALSTAVVGSVSQRKESPFDLREVWEHALGVAVAAKLIAKRRGVDAKHLEEYFIAGMLHDIGQILLISYVPTAYHKAVSRSDENLTTLSEEEVKVFGCDHAHLGALIADKWHLTPNLISAIRHHHEPEHTLDHEHSDFILTTAAANYFVHKQGLGFRGDSLFDPLDESVWTALGKSEEEFEADSFDGLADEVEKAAVFLNS
jgi:putative nucleotidyltransferase with HDIG domain